MNMNAILTTTKGNQLLLHEGYQYRFVSKTKRDARSIYRCIKKGCKSRLHADSGGKVMCIRNPHNHSENYSAAQVSAAISSKVHLIVFGMRGWAFIVVFFF